MLLDNTRFTEDPDLQSKCVFLLAPLYESTGRAIAVTQASALASALLKC